LFPGIDEVVGTNPPGPEHSVGPALADDVPRHPDSCASGRRQLA
jgi:hypothetical protein